MPPNTHISLTFFGGAGGNVTGSHMRVETENADVYIDAGSPQGDDRKLCIPTGVHGKKLRAQIGTHPHLDHTGELAQLFVTHPDLRLYLPAGTHSVVMQVLQEVWRLTGGKASMSSLERNMTYCWQRLEEIRKLERKQKKTIQRNRSGKIENTVPHHIRKEQDQTLEDLIEAEKDQIEYVLGDMFPLVDTIEEIQNAIGNFYHQACALLEAQGIVSHGFINGMGKHLREVPLGQWNHIFGESSLCDFLFRLENAGHLHTISAAQIFLKIFGKTFAFSGDLGRSDLPPPFSRPSLATMAGCADVVVTESTYGDREHPDLMEQLGKLERILKEAIANGTDVVIPIFSLDKPPVVLYRILELVDQGKLSRHDFEVLMYGASIAERMESMSPSHPIRQRIGGEFTFMRKSELPRMAQKSRSGKTRIAFGAGGFVPTGCPAGLLIEQALIQPRVTFLITGYPGGPDSNARCMLERRPLALTPQNLYAILGEGHKVEQVSIASGHADRLGLLEYVRQITRTPKEGEDGPIVIINHGDRDAGKSLQETIIACQECRKKRIRVILPELGETLRIQ